MGQVEDRALDRVLKLFRKWMEMDDKVTYSRCFPLGRRLQRDRRASNMIDAKREEIHN
jgi:hypothetical protein